MPTDEDDDVRRVQATPLMRACRQEQKDVVIALLDSQVPACIVDVTGKTALHYLVDCSDASIADLLIDHDPSILEIGDCEGITALGLAVIHGNERLVRRLAERHANVGSKDNEGHSMAHLATAYGQLEMIDLLDSLGVDFSSADNHGATSLHYAAQLIGEQGGSGSVRVLQKLLSKRVDVDSRDSTQRTPLIWAASSGHWKACEILLKEGAQMEAFDNDGLTALHCAASQGHIRCVEVLLRSGADPNNRDRSECSPLFYAIALNHIDCVQSLLNAGAEPNHKDIKARSPAHCAATLGSVPMLEMLRLKGGDLWMPNQKGNYPVHDAALSKNTDAVKYLLEISKDSNKMVNLRSLEGRSLLHLAAMTDNISLLQYLLDQGAYPNPMITSKGKELTPFDVTKLKNNITGMEYLRLSGGIPGSECDERIRIEDRLASKEAQEAVDKEHGGDAAPSSIASCRSPDGAEAAEDENNRKDADNGYHAEDARGCYNLEDGDALEAKAAVIVSSVLSRAMSLVESEQSEDSLRTDTTFRSGVASMRVAKTRSVPRLRPPKKKQNKKVYKKLEYDDHAKTVYSLPLPPVFEPGARDPKLKDPRPTLSVENAARLKEKATVYGVSKERSRNSRWSEKEPKKMDSKRFNASFTGSTAAKRTQNNASEIVMTSTTRDDDVTKGSDTMTCRSSRRIDLPYKKTSESLSSLPAIDDTISRTAFSNNSLDNNGISASQSDSMAGHLADRNNVFASSDSLKRLPRNGFTPNRQAVLPQINRAAGSTDANGLRSPRQRTFGTATNNRDPCAETATSGDRKADDRRKRVAEGEFLKTKNVNHPLPRRTRKKVVAEPTFHPRRKNRNLIQEYVRVFELKRRTTNELHEVKRRQMCGQYIDSGGGGDTSDRSWIRKLAKDYNMNASIYDSHFDETKLEDVQDFEKQLRSELQRALKEEEWLKSLSRAAYEILPRESVRVCGGSSAASQNQHIASDQIRRSIRENYGHDKDVVRKPLRSHRHRHLPEIRPAVL